MNLRSLAQLAAATYFMACASPGLAQWRLDGVPVCTDPGTQDIPLAVPDGSGGAFISWRDQRNPQGDVYVQRLLTGGTIAPGWPINGIRAGTDSSSVGGWNLVADGQGGVILVWEDFRNSQVNAIDLYALRLTAVGEVASGWKMGGLPVSVAPEQQRRPQIASDGQGGAIIAWEDFRDGNSTNSVGGDIYIARLDGAGQPAPGWLLNGQALCACEGDDLFPLLVPYASGGVTAVWRNDGQLRAQHLSGTGLPVESWPDTGVVVSGPEGAPARAWACPDGSSGLYVAWEDFRTLPPPPSGFAFFLDVYLQHLTASGGIAEGWPRSGLPVCTLLDGQFAPNVASDGTGGALISWDDYRSGVGAIYAQRVLASGARSPGWPENGLLVSSQPGSSSFNRLSGDGLGGAFVAYENYQGHDKVWVQHLLGDGRMAPGWGESGVEVAATPGNQFQPWLVPSGTGAIVVWADDRDYLASYGDIYAQRFVGDGPVPVAVSLLSVRAEPDRVELRWFAPQGPDMGTVYRRGAEDEWRSLGSAQRDGSGTLHFVDREVEPGERFAYRLQYFQLNGAEAFTGESWVDIPKEAALSLEGLRPNPAHGEVVAVFSLGSTAAATLELLDVTGRRVVTREVGARGPGRHTLRLDKESAIAPGIYWLTIRQAGESRAQRAVVAR